MKDKILKKIEELEAKKIQIEEVQKKFQDESNREFDEDTNFLNVINPFYKRKTSASKDTARIFTVAFMLASIDNEIETLRVLL